MMKSPMLTHILNHDLRSKNAHLDQRESIMSDIVSGRIPAHEVAEIPIRYLDFTRLPGVPEQNILTPSLVYKPFRYEFGYWMWERQNQIHWMHTEIKLDQDLQDWKTKLNTAQKNLATNIFPLFVQNDVLINNVYIHEYAPIFRPQEIEMGISAIANMESIHKAAYSHLLTELGFTDAQYSAFLEIKEMMDKYNFTAGFRMDTLLGIAVAMLVFGAFTEGLQLFGSFALLFNYSRHNMLKGMGQVVSLSVKDESLHVQFVAQLFKHFMLEYGHLIDKKRLQDAAYNAVRTIVEGEHRFIDMAFAMGPVDDLTAEDTKGYICNTADMRLEQFKLEPIYNVENPFKSWIGGMMGNLEHANFFEQRSSSYSKASTRGVWDDSAFD